MKYVDYDLDLSKEKIVLDREITLEKLDWHILEKLEVNFQKNGNKLLKMLKPDNQLGLARIVG
jgi:hypothetical protein